MVALVFEKTNKTLLIEFFVLGAIQIKRDTLRGWGSRQCHQGGSKIGQKSVTYYLNGPLVFYYDFKIQKMQK